MVTSDKDIQKTWWAALLIIICLALFGCSTTSSQQPIQSETSVVVSATSITQQACASGMISDPKVCAAAATAWFIEQAFIAAQQSGNPDLVSKVGELKE